jgi:predicted Zn-ribbon and HTH transcriptional regulator
VEKLICKRCGWEWVKRIETEPKNCPGCKSPYWNKKRLRPVKEKKK